MSLWRSTIGASARRGHIRKNVERLDERIVPDTTGTVINDPTSSMGTTPSGSSTTTTSGSSSTTTSGSSTTTTSGSSTVTTGSSSTSATNTTQGTTTTTTTTTGGNGSTTTTTTTTPGDSTPPPVVQYAVGADGGNFALVRVYDNTGAKTSEFIAYPNFKGGVHAAIGDVTGDGVADIITGPGPGMKPLVKVFDGVTGQQLLSFNAYDPSFRGGVNIAVADMNNDGRADIITGAGDGGGSHVKVFDGKGLFPPEGGVGATLPPGPDNYILRQFFAYDAKYLVGARVAVADVNGDGKLDIITAPGTNGGPHIRVFSGADGTIYREWFAYDAKFSGGVYVAAGDLNGDGHAEVVTGMGANGIGQVKVFDGNSGRQLREFTPDGAAVRVSSRVSVFDFDMDGDPDIVVGDLNQINAYDGKTYVRTGGLTPFDPTHIGGFFFS